MESGGDHGCHQRAAVGKDMGRGTGGQPVIWVPPDLLSKMRRQQLLLWSEEGVFRAQTGSSLVCVLVLLWVAREGVREQERETVT